MKVYTSFKDVENDKLIGFLPELDKRGAIRLAEKEKRKNTLMLWMTYYSGTLMIIMSS